MCNAISMLLGLILLTPTEQQPAVRLGEKTVLVYENASQSSSQEFVIRLARFGPDIVFEWESLSHQGTVHLLRKAVAEARRLSISSLFDPGVDVVSKDLMTKWLSRKVFEELEQRGETKLDLNRISIQVRRVGASSYKLEIDRKEVVLDAIQLQDSRQGIWLFLNERGNPLLLEYRTPFYTESLRRISTEGALGLRWFKSIPPVK